MPVENRIDQTPNLPLSASKRIDEHNVEDGLDRINLTILRDRFLKLNQQRLDKLRHSLLPAQQILLDILPLLFHVNHPALPGYGNADIPRGIRNFKLTNKHIKSARQLNKSFALQRELNPTHDICGIYFMGSCSSIAHNNRSDIDVWLCPRSDLNTAGKEALKKKCDAISQWADGYRMEIHFFIMDDEEFRQGKRASMDQEDCGNTQHFLLLDEFYRTHIVVAGCTPLWWFVPATFDDDYENYANTLLGKRYLKEFACIDFGTPGQIPASEFISAGVWQLYKGIYSPYKALLKLLLIEVYASEFPNTVNLSTEFKREMYLGDCIDDSTADHLDPYIQIYRRIENYLLERNEYERLELIRRCLYFKAGIKLSSVPDEVSAEEFLKNGLKNPTQWKRNTIQKLVAGWGWRRPTLLKLDQLKRWPFKEAKAEQIRLTKELIHSYRLLTELVKRQNDKQIDSAELTDNTLQKRNSMELNLLGRQLYATFEHKPNKIPYIPGGIIDVVSNTSNENTLGLSVENNSEGRAIWHLHIEGEISSSGDKMIIKKSESPAELLIWSIANGLVNDATRFHIDEGDHDLCEYELKQLYTSLSNHLPQSKHALSNGKTKEVFAKPAKIIKCLFIANCGIDPLKAHQELDIWRISEKNDPLAYSGIAENLIASITLVTMNSWGEIFSLSFKGKNALIDCLTSYYTLLGSEYSAGANAHSDINAEISLPKRTVLCACPTRPTAIADRIKNLMESIDECYALSTDTALQKNQFEIQLHSKQFIFESAVGFHLFEWRRFKPEISMFDSEEKLVEHLSKPDNIHPFSIDQMALKHHPLGTICRKFEASSFSENKNQVNIFYEVKGDTAETYLMDQHHTLAFAPIPYESLRSLVTPIRQFVKQSELRRLSTTVSLADGNISDNVNSSTELPEIEFFALKKNGSKYIATHVPTESKISAGYLSIKAVGSQNTHGDITWSIYCNEEMFDQAILGEQLYTEVARSITAYRQSSQARYRCYITDIEVSSTTTSYSSLTQSFYHKNRLEEKINQAYEQLAP